MEDRVDPAKFNRIVWYGLVGDETPYPAERNGIDLRENRKELLKKGLIKAEEALNKRGRQ